MVEPHGGVTRHVHRVCDRHTDNSLSQLNLLWTCFRAPIRLFTYIYSYACSQPLAYLHPFTIGREGGRWKREKERRREEGGRRSGKACVTDQTAGVTERASTPSSICLSDPQGRDEAVAQEGAQNSVKKGVHFGTHKSRVSVHASHEALTLHSPVAHPGSPCSGPRLAPS